MNTPEVFCFIILTAFMSLVSLILVIFFLRSQDKSRKSFSHPNKSPHTKVNNINTYVSGVSAGALLKLIFQNVFSALSAATGEPSHPQPSAAKRGAVQRSSWAVNWLPRLRLRSWANAPAISSRSFSSLLAPPCLLLLFYLC